MVLVFKAKVKSSCDIPPVSACGSFVTPSFIDASLRSLEESVEEVTTRMLEKRSEKISEYTSDYESQVCGRRKSPVNEYMQPFVFI
ncbi:hypothetical protein E5288_WYG009197 [Bos mutus]|uniref:Uncharacterized protein n=1 Tax=Bos mutus TaxID=72004 RepID=A0A6B0QZ62_9CETA|nr:hypothetical protein [Bos mutus]